MITYPCRFLLVALLLSLPFTPLAISADETATQATPTWKYAPELLRPFWHGETVHGESVLFLKSSESEPAKSKLYFPFVKVLAVTNSAGTITYEEGRDYTWQPGSRELVLPAGSRIVSKTPADLRRPPKTQKYALTHRDGNGEIFFASGLEYHEMQTAVTYTHAADEWKGPKPEFAEKSLARTIGKLRAKQPVNIVLLGDSISTGCNASGWAKGAPFQPAWQDLLQEHLAAHYASTVTLENLAVGGTSTPWGVTMSDKVAAAKPDLVVLAFGMNDSSGRPAAEYEANISAIMKKVREARSETDFILVATMLGNRDWVALKPELFPQYRDSLAKLTGPGVALADLTTTWATLFQQKQDWDLTGNGVNHPNDFGHRIYAQTISALLIPPK